MNVLKKKKKVVIAELLWGYLLDWLSYFPVEKE